MTKKKWIILLSALAILIAGIVFVCHRERELTPEEMIDRIERATREVLGDEYKKASVTKVAATLTYSNGDEASNIYYHTIQTTYYEAGDPAAVTGLNTDAFNVLFPVDLMDSCEEMMIQDWHGALYKKDDKAYLCWTCDPELSYTLEYNPTTTQDADIIRMAESVKPVGEE